MDLGEGWVKISTFPKVLYISYLLLESKRGMLYRNSSMTPPIFHKAAMRCNVIPLITEADQSRKSIRFRRMQFLSTVLMFILLVATIVRADPYEVLVVDIAETNDVARIEEFEKDAEKFNSLNRQGYSAARPYFNVLQMTNEKVYFVFGFRGEVQGIHRRNYPGTIENLRRMKYKGAPKYPRMHWLPVEEIRRLLTAPLTLYLVPLFYLASKIG
jgi:hypothetical protein